MLGERAPAASIVDQLQWFEIHPWWRAIWTSEDVFSKLRAVNDKGDDLFVEFLNRYWWHGDANLEGPILSAGLAPCDTRDTAWLGDSAVLRNLYVRSSGYLPRVLGEPVSLDVRDYGDRTFSIVARGPQMMARIDKTALNERLSLAPSDSSTTLEWLDVERLVRVYESFRFICSGSNFEAFLQLLERSEKLHEEFKSVAIYGLHGSE
jgi:hypothetical protein